MSSPTVMTCETSPPLVAHRNFADEPVARGAVRAALSCSMRSISPGLEGARELALQSLARLARQHLEDVAPQHLPRAGCPARPARGCDSTRRCGSRCPRVERDGQAVNDRLGETPLRFGLGRAPLDLLRARLSDDCARRLVERRDVRGERGLLRGGINQTALRFAAVLRAGRRPRRARPPSARRSAAARRTRRACSSSRRRNFSRVFQISSEAAGDESSQRRSDFAVSNERGALRAALAVEDAGGDARRFSGRCSHQLFAPLSSGPASSTAAQSAALVAS